MATKLKGLSLEATGSKSDLTVEAINSCSITMQKALCAIALAYGITDKVSISHYDRKDGTKGTNLTLTNAECVQLLTELGVI